ncbi:MAG: sigma 54-interacting transcriptional regulator [Roseobacter sp.]|jgi:two-component system response regulator HupR/HoxA
MKDSRPLPTVLILGGTPKEQADMERALSDEFDCLKANLPGEAWTLMSSQFVHVAICAGDLDGNGCVEVFEYLLAHWPETMLVVVGDSDKDTHPHSNIQQVLPRAWSPAQLTCAVSSAARVFHLTRENERLALEMRCKTRSLTAPRRDTTALGFESIIRVPGSPMAAVVNAARQFASFDVPILLIGEAGTGKSKLARAIHDSSLRSDKPFRSLDLTGMSDAAVQLALFGRRKPANGSPPVQKAGLVHKAEQGTLYLAGVETLSRDLQLRLLRLARDGSFEPDGAAEPEQSSARLIASVTVDPHLAIETGALDAALYFALSIAELTLPPLRARKGDIPLLARAAAEDAGRLHGKMVHGLDDAALGFLSGYRWPGNLWELENEITRMLILTQQPLLGPEVISRHILQASPVPENADQAGIMTADGPLKDRIEAIEARILRETLTRLHWNKSRSAAELGLSRVGLRAKLDRYGITPPQKEEA